MPVYAKISFFLLHIPTESHLFPANTSPQKSVATRPVFVFKSDDNNDSEVLRIDGVWQDTREPFSLNVLSELQDNQQFYSQLFFETSVPNPCVDAEGKTKLPVGSEYLCFAAYLSILVLSRSVRSGKKPNKKWAETTKPPSPKASWVSNWHTSMQKLSIVLAFHMFFKRHQRRQLRPLWIETRCLLYTVSHHYGFEMSISQYLVWTLGKMDWVMVVSSYKSMGQNWRHGEPSEKL